MDRVARGECPDRVPFVPSVYEHGARLIKQAPGPTSRDAELMARAALQAYELYQHDLVTVGIDIYNIEPQAFGCEVSRGDDGSIPGVKTHPLADAGTRDFDQLAIPQADEPNRLGVIEEACRRVYEQIGAKVWVYGCMSGPFSQAVELRGFEQLIVDTIENPQSVHRLLERTTELTKQQATRLSETGCGVNLYESWATIPLITPALFAEYVVPYNRRVIEMVTGRYNTEPPAVIMGGNINLLVDFFIEVGTSLMAVDYKADFDLIKARTAATDIITRGCVDPKLIEREDWDTLQASIDQLARKSRNMNNFVWGCGCVTFDTSVESLLHFKDMCLSASGA
jgi:uroporphyrinogen decarboxylase